MDKLICPYCRKGQTAHEPDPADTFCNLENAIIAASHSGMV